MCLFSGPYTSIGNLAKAVHSLSVVSKGKFTCVVKVPFKQAFRSVTLRLLTTPMQLIHSNSLTSVVSSCALLHVNSSTMDDSGSSCFSSSAYSTTNKVSFQACAHRQSFGNATASDGSPQESSDVCTYIHALQISTPITSTLVFIFSSTPIASTSGQNTLPLVTQPLSGVPPPQMMKKLFFPLCVQLCRILSSWLV